MGEWVGGLNGWVGEDSLSNSFYHTSEKGSTVYQANFDGSNIFETVEIWSRYG